MEKTTNKYSYPVLLNRKIKVDYKSSPAHKDKLKYSVDFICDENTPIKASYGGVVVDVKQNSGVSGKSKKYDKHGNYIEIKHKNQEYSIYEHIKKKGSTVMIGEKVKTGQLIGYSGKTGWIAHLGPHLHFGVHKYFGKGPNDYQTLKIKWNRKVPIKRAGS